MIHVLNVEEFKNSLKDRDGEIIHIGGIDYYNSIIALIELFQLQDSFQQKAMGQNDWWNVPELNSKPVDYSIAMLGEVGEGIASLDFKWWSGLDTLDQENFITELVDALHFDLSNTMRIFYALREINKFDKEYEQNYIRELFDYFGGAVGNSFGYEQEHYELFKDSDRLNLIKEYIFHSLSKDRDCRTILNFGVYSEELQKVNGDLFKSLYYLFELANAYGVSFETMILRYKLKNALNHVRKMNGYKEGTYKKMWLAPSGEVVEDNKAAGELIVDATIPFAEIITILDTYYKTKIATI